jgi:hypothetical protein
MTDKENVASHDSDNRDARLRMAERDSEKPDRSAQ